jgi:hypothetical protein
MLGASRWWILYGLKLTIWYRSGSGWPGSMALNLAGCLSLSCSAVRPGFSPYVTRYNPSVPIRAAMYQCSGWMMKLLSAHW